jgi:hypothetical protein
VLSTPHTCGARDSAALRPPEGPPLLTHNLISANGVADTPTVASTRLGWLPTAYVTLYECVVYFHSFTCSLPHFVLIRSLSITRFSTHSLLVPALVACLPSLFTTKANNYIRPALHDCHMLHREHHTVDTRQTHCQQIRHCQVHKYLQDLHRL